MFTGLIQHVGSVSGVSRLGDGVRLEIDPRRWGYEPEPGGSIAVNGVCLTILPESTGASWYFDVVAQTLSRTVIGSWVPGQDVNLESAALPSTPLGGHVVQGHVDGVGTVSDVHSGDLSTTLSITVARPTRAYLFDQGSIAVDGVSLTIAKVTEEGFDVAVIPETLRRTTLADRRDGDDVHIETDMLIRAIVETARRVHATSDCPLS